MVIWFSLNFCMFALRSSLLNLSKSIQKSLSMKNNKSYGSIFGIQKREAFFFFKEKTAPPHKTIYCTKSRITTLQAFTGTTEVGKERTGYKVWHWRSWKKSKNQGSLIRSVISWNLRHWPRISAAVEEA